MTLPNLARRGRYTSKPTRRGVVCAPGESPIAAGSVAPQRSGGRRPKVPTEAELRRNAGYLLTAITEHFEAEGFGKKAGRMAIRFLQAHAGCTINMPDTVIVERMAAELRVVDALDRDPDLRTSNRLADIQDLPQRMIPKLYKRLTGHGISSRRPPAQRAAEAQPCRHPRLSRHRRCVRV